MKHLEIGDRVYREILGWNRRPMRLDIYQITRVTPARAFADSKVKGFEFEFDRRPMPSGKYKMFGITARFTLFDAEAEDMLRMFQKMDEIEKALSVFDIGAAAGDADAVLAILGKYKRK